MDPVTPDDVRELLNSRKLDPVLVRWITSDQWHDADEIEVVSNLILRERYVRADEDEDADADYEQIISRDDLISSGGTDWENPSQADLEITAEWLND